MKQPRDRGENKTRQLVVEPTHFKNMLVKLDHETPSRDENKKYLKPPTRPNIGGIHALLEVYMPYTCPIGSG